jgi:hypothetical protein
VPLQSTATRLWKRLTLPERLEAATQFWKEPAPEMAASALAALVKARHMRPQAARSLSTEDKARVLAQVLEPGEPLAASLIVALHLGVRRAMLAAFLDLLGIPHEEGLLKEEAASLPPPTAERAKAAVVGLLERFAPQEVETYVNALWLQDSDYWDALAPSSEWITAASPASPAAEEK